MTPLWTLVVLSVVGAAGALLAVTGWMQERPALERVVAHLRREGPLATAAMPGTLDRAGTAIADGALGRRVLPAASDLRIVRRRPEQHATLLLLAAVVGLSAPVLVIGTAQAFGVIALGWFVPVGAALFGALLAPLAVHARLVERVRVERTDLRHQLSAYLDVVTMLLAGNTGYEGALEQAAGAGDGRLFVEIRRRMREVGTTGRSLVHALDVVGVDLGIVELRQVAATASLSAAEGAPVARTLAAKCSTLRSTLATEQEAEARLRTSRLTAPLVGMALIFMALVIYPALYVP